MIPSSAVSLAFSGLRIIHNIHFLSGFVTNYSTGIGRKVLVPSKLSRCLHINCSKNTYIAMGSISASSTANSITPASSSIVQVTNNITKSLSDKREYRCVELSNGLKALLISDPETDKSAGALSVGAGAMSDPVELPGLAHFCEHMLFLGTEKYPDESDFDKFLSSHGGGSNAATYSDHTTYRFDVSPDTFALALDRFAQFFISPLFNESSTEREVNAVNSENEKNVPNDSRRAHQVERATVNQNHAYSKFSTGNYYSLWTRPLEKGISVRDALLAFHQTYYSANIMALSILGKESLDQLQEMVVTMFSPAVSRNVELPKWAETPYTDEVCQLNINVSPIKDLRKLSILFPAPDVNPFYKSGSIQYITHLLGHEGPGSLLSLLKKKNWVNELMAWSETCGRGSAQLEILLELSIEGWDNQNDVVEHVFQYIKMMKSHGVQKWIWEEIRDTKEIKFRFKEKSRPESYTYALAQKFHECPNPEDILSAGFLMTEYKPELITDILEGLIPEKCRILTMAKANDSKANLTEEWYKAKYWTEKIDPVLIEKWKNCNLHPELAFPPKNGLIPSVFDLKPREDTGIIPGLLMNNNLITGWFLQDNEFLLPRACIQLELFSPLPLNDPLSYDLNYMMVEIIADNLMEFTYMADLAGMRYEIKGTYYGVELKFSGYDQKLELLMNQVLEKIINFQFEPCRLSILLEKYRRSLKNWQDNEPRIHANYYLDTLMTLKRWTKQELLEALDNVTPESLHNYSQLFRSNLKFNFLAFGNLSSQDSTTLMQQCQQLFESNGTNPLSDEQLLRSKEVHLPEGSDVLYKTEHLVHSNSCAVVYFQSGQQSDHQNVLLSLLMQLASERFYTQARTQEQLGYIVGAFKKRFHNTQGFAFLIQSLFHPDYLESRIDDFLQKQRELIKEMSADEFQTYKVALHVMIAEKPKTIEGRAHRVWNQILNEQYNFDYQNIELSELDKITQAELLAFYEDLFGCSTSTGKGRAAVHVISMADGGAGTKVESSYPNPIPPTKRNAQKVENLKEWKNQQELYGYCEPKIALTRK